MNLDGKVALVTGSSSGIGEATARSLAAAGAAVVINSSSSAAAGQAVADSLPKAFYVQASVADAAACQALVDATLAQYGRLDILVNNAGTTQLIPHGDLDAATDEVWDKILSTNLMGTWHMTRSSVPALKASGAGSVINVTSVAGLRQAGSSIPYAVSKAGINHLTKLLANVLGPEIRVNAVAPGLVDTPWTADWAAVRERVTAQAPLKRPALPEDVAEVIMGLVQAGFVTGQVVTVDGGMSLR
ncbi:MAG: glucose 1-dehydrogenase [Actinomycetota bacterium]|nr:glucose 1-dehydrogenase [Actinomycetota bacterium]